MKKRLLAAAVAGAVMLSAGAQAQDSAAPEGYQLAGADHEPSQPARAAGQ